MNFSIDFCASRLTICTSEPILMSSDSVSLSVFGLWTLRGNQNLHLKLPSLRLKCDSAFLTAIFPILVLFPETKFHQFVHTWSLSFFIQKLHPFPYSFELASLSIYPKPGSWWRAPHSILPAGVTMVPSQWATSQGLVSAEHHKYSGLNIVLLSIQAYYWLTLYAPSWVSVLKIIFIFACFAVIPKERTYPKTCMLHWRSMFLSLDTETCKR